MRIAPTTVGKICAEGDEILTNTVVIHFAPNDWDLHKKKGDGLLYDPNVDSVLEGVGKLVGAFGVARVIIEGHTDSSMKGNVPAEVVKTLSTNRAAAVRDALAAKYPGIDASRFYADGMGWDRPADPQNPLDQAKTAAWKSRLPDRKTVTFCETIQPTEKEIFQWQDNRKPRFTP